MIHQVKVGYPPQSLTLIPELPIESLGLKAGEQIIVAELPEIAASSRPSSPIVNRGTEDSHPPIGSSSSGSSETSPPLFLTRRPPQSSGPDYVQMDGGVLMHRVRVIRVYCGISSDRSTIRSYQMTTLVSSLLWHYCSSRASTKLLRCGRVRHARQSVMLVHWS